MGNKISIEKERRGLPKESGLYQYSYDALYRLAAVTRDDILMTRYTYDSLGNRQRKEDFAAGSITTYNYNTLNQLITACEEGPGCSGHKDYIYDNRGNLIREQEEGKLLHSYEYGALNRLEKFCDRKGNVMEYAYNGLGRLTKRDQTEFLLDITKLCNNLIQIREEESSKSFYWDNNLAAMEDTREDACWEGIVHPYLLDELGSPLRVEKGAGIYESYGYDAFGEDMYGNQGVYQPFGYTGEYTDLGTKTIYLRARYYSPTTGRFLAEDFEKDGLNWYAYCNNNPILYIDPSGCSLKISGTEEYTDEILNYLKELTSDDLTIKDGEVLIKNEVENPTLVSGTELIRRVVNNQEFTTTILYNPEYMSPLTEAGPGAAASYSVLRNPPIAKYGSGSDSVINFDAFMSEDPTLLVDPTTTLVSVGYSPVKIILAHEIIHAERAMRGSWIRKKEEYSYKIERHRALGFLWWIYEYKTEGITDIIYREEYATMGLMKKLNKDDITENMIREEHGEWLRGAYLCD